MSEPHFDFEREAMAQGLHRVAGVDEVGRGPLAGPVGVAAVILDPKTCRKGSTIRRRFAKPGAMRCGRLFSPRRSASRSCSPALEEIDLYNIRGAALRAMARAVRALSVRPQLALIDGRDIPDGLGCPARAIIGGDALSMSIAAASIVAKTTRDALMRNLAAGISPVWLCRSCRLCDGVPPAGAGGLRSLPLSPALVPAGGGFDLRLAGRPPKVAKVFKEENRAATLFPYENDTASAPAA